MALQRMGIVKDYEKIRSKTVGRAGQGGQGGQGGQAAAAGGGRGRAGGACGSSQPCAAPPWGGALQGPTGLPCCPPARAPAGCHRGGGRRGQRGGRDVHALRRGAPHALRWGWGWGRVAEGGGQGRAGQGRGGQGRGVHLLPDGRMLAAWCQQRAGCRRRPVAAAAPHPGHHAALLLSSAHNLRQPPATVPPLLAASSSTCRFVRGWFKSTCSCPHHPIPTTHPLQTTTRWSWPT
jgi:hypothetical protein